MASLTGTKIKDTYDGLLKTNGNAGLDGSLVQISDGLGTVSVLKLSTSEAQINNRLMINSGTPLDSAVKLQVTGTSSGASSIWSNADDIIFDHNDNLGMTFVSPNTSAQTIAFADPDAVNSGYIQYVHSDDYLRFATNAVERMRIDSSGNVGIGVTPETWATAGGTKALQVSTRTALWEAYNNVFITNNVYYDGSAKYLETDEAAQMYIGADGIFTFSNAASGTADTAITFTERMRIDSSGNITQTASDPSFVIASSNAGGYSTLSLKGLGTNGTSVADVWLRGIAEGSGAASAFTVYTRNSSGSRIERMRITSGGQLQLGGTTQSFNARVVIHRDSYSIESRSTGTASEGHIVFRNANGAVGSITTNGTSTAYNTSSDYRLKEDWQPMTNSLDKISSLKPVNFAWKADGSRVDGFLAHELALVVPEAVTGEKDATEEYEVTPAEYKTVVVTPAQEAVYETIEHAEELDEDGNVITEAWTEEVLVSEAVEEVTEQVLVSEAVMGTRPVYQGIDQSKIVPLLTAGLQEAHEMIKQLQVEIAALKAK